MSKRFSNAKILSTAILLSILMTLTGCGGGYDTTGYTLKNGTYENDSPAAVAVILGKHANAMAIPDDAYKSIGQILNDAVYGGYACAIISDSYPTKVDLEAPEFYREDAKNPQILNKRIESRSVSLIKDLKKLDVADDEEVDLLGAIREAKNALSSSNLDSISDKRIIIVDTGISTSGDLDFTTMDVQRGAPKIDEVVNLLESYKVLPNLADNISVTFIGTSDGLAETAKPQIMSTGDKQYIKELWYAIIQKCGVINEKISFISEAGWNVPNVYTEDVDSQFPFVSFVPFYHESKIDLSRIQTANGSDPDSPPDLPNPPVVDIEIKSAVVGFMGDKAEYKDANVAKGILEQTAVDLKEYMNAYPDEPIWIVGTSATQFKDGEGSFDLSLARADKVKETLAELGVPEERLYTIGLGAKFPWHVSEFVNGKFDNVSAQDNRSAWILNTIEANDKFTMLKEAYEKTELLPQAMERFALNMA